MRSHQGDAPVIVPGIVAGEGVVVRVPQADAVVGIIPGIIAGEVGIVRRDQGDAVQSVVPGVVAGEVVAVRKTQADAIVAVVPDIVAGEVGVVRALQADAVLGAIPDRVVDERAIAGGVQINPVTISGQRVVIYPVWSLAILNQDAVGAVGNGVVVGGEEGSRVVARTVYSIPKVGDNVVVNRQVSSILYIDSLTRAVFYGVVINKQGGVVRLDAPGGVSHKVVGDVCCGAAGIDCLGGIVPHPVAINQPRRLTVHIHGIVRDSITEKGVVENRGVVGIGTVDIFSHAVEKIV